MNRRFSRLHNVKVGIHSPPGYQHRSSGCASLMARSFRLHARLCLLTGCFFIRGLYGSNTTLAPRVVWKSPYTFYSGCCLAFLLWMDLQEVVDRAYRGTPWRNYFEGGLWVFAHVVLFLRSLLNFLCISFCSSKIMDFFNRSAAFENRVGIPSCDCCAPKRFLQSDVLRVCFCFLYCAALSASSPIHDAHRSTGDDAWEPFLQVYFWSKKVVLMIQYFVYDSIYFVALNASSQVFEAYVESQLRVLKQCVHFKSSASADDFDASRRVESVRINLSIICQLKEDFNAVWLWPLVLSSVCVLLIPCTSIYLICTDAGEFKETLSLCFFSGCLAYEFWTLSSSSQSMLNKVNKIRAACKATQGIEDASYRHQIELLHAWTDPEDMVLKGGDFFELKMSLLCSIAGTVITYGVIMVQTNPTFSTSGNTTSTV